MPAVVAVLALLWRKEATHFPGDPPPFFLQTVITALLKQHWTQIYEVEPKYYPMWCTGSSGPVLPTSVGSVLSKPFFFLSRRWKKT